MRPANIACQKETHHDKHLTKLKLWELIPEPILVALVRLWANTHYFEIVATKHSNAARDEMQQLVDEFEMLARNTSVAIPAMDRLSIYVNPTDWPIAEGIATILNSKMGIKNDKQKSVSPKNMASVANRGSRSNSMPRAD